MEIKPEEHHGKIVFVSVQAEAARKSGCLCIREESGAQVMCKHLRANLEFDESMRKMGAVPPPEEFVNEIRDHNARLYLEDMLNGTDSPINPLNGMCRLALILFSLCKVGDLALAVTRCPHYEAESEETSPSAKPGRCCQ
ncbi:MAG: hypothetical protein Q8P49_02125 [Candidatus Liptonbacteria bacterium]|nr:hypothetical protein [Candidatus Liptonbacteria bacterium]